MRLEKAPFIILIAACLLACNGEKGSGPGESGSVLNGILRLPGGKPAANARVRLYPVGFVPGPSASVAKTGAEATEGAEGDPSFLVRTDAQGRYRVDSVERGEYNVIAESEDLVALRDSVFLSPGYEQAIEDTLGTAGGVAARVELQSIHDPRKATVHVLGTSAYTNVDENGGFTLKGLAAGRYSLVIDVREADYAPLYATIEVTAGRVDSLSAPLRVPYTGIPLVRGLRVSLDTLAGVARLHWNPVTYRSLKSYVILRMRKNTVEGYFTAVGVTEDTTWTDSLYSVSNIPGYPTYPSYPTNAINQEFELEYQIAVRSQTLEMGPTYGSVGLSAVPPSRVITVVSRESRGDDNGDASLNDTVKVTAFFRNPARNLASLEWREAKSDSLMRTVRLGSGINSGFDTLTLVGNVLRTYYLACDVTDDAGRTVRQRYDIHFVSSPPKAIAGNDLVVGGGDTVVLSGRYTNRFGPAKLEWDIGATGAFTEEVDGKLRFPGPEANATDTCILRATNGDGEIGLDTLLVLGSYRWEKIGDAPIKGNFGQLVEFRNRLWLIGGIEDDGAGGVYSTVDGADWRAEPVPDSIGKRTDQMAFVFRDSLWIGGGLLNGAGERGDFWNSPDGVEWHLAADQPSAAFREARAAVLDTGLYMVKKDNYDILFFSSENGREFGSDRMRNVGWLEPVRGMSVLDGKLYIMVSISQSLASWRRVPGSPWERLPIVPTMTGVLVTHGGRLWMYGCAKGERDETNASVFSSGDGIRWRQEADLPVAAARGSLVASYDGSLWLIDHNKVYRSR